jgi:hypothetical protein
LYKFMLPNEDFGSPNEHLGTYFRSNSNERSQKEYSPFEGTSKMRSQTFVWGA